MAVALANIREQAYPVIRQAIVDNKVSGTTVINSFPEQDPTFPCYVLPMQDVPVSPKETLSGSVRQYEVIARLSVYAQVGDGQVSVAQMLDSVQAAFDGSDLSSDNLEFEGADFSEIDKLEVNEEKLYTAGVILRFTYIK